MPRASHVFAWSLLFLATLVASARAQRVHQIRLVANPDKEIYRFEPAQVTARPGDMLVFRAATGVPHSIVFEGGKLSEPAHEALNGAMSRRSADLSSPLLTLEGAEYRMVVPPLSPGTYEFFCLPHRAYDMRGSLTVSK
jgi:plastocyanin